MKLEELITDLKAAGCNENTMQLARNFYLCGQKDERKACAQIADSWIVNVVWEVKQIAKNIGIEIRARGQHEGR